MDAGAVAELLDRLAEPGTTIEAGEAIMAQLDAARLDAVPWVYQRLHDARDEADVHAASRVLVRWRHDRLAAALAPALRAMIGERAVGDLSKLAAAALLERMGHPVDDEELQRSLTDPVAAADHALLAALGAADGAAALVNQLDALGSLAPASAQSLVEDLVRLADPRALRVLGPLVHIADAATAMAAVTAIDRLGLGEGWFFLESAAAHHPDAAVRREAGRTMERLGAAGRRPRRLAPAEGVRTLASRGSPRVVLLVVPARAGPGDRHDVVSMVVDEVAGVKEYAVAEALRPTELDSLVERFASGGVTLEEEGPDRTSRLLAGATARSLASGGVTRLGHLAWPFLVGAPENGAAATAGSGP